MHGCPRETQRETWIIKYLLARNYANALTVRDLFQNINGELLIYGDPILRAVGYEEANSLIYNPPQRITKVCRIVARSEFRAQTPDLADDDMYRQ